MPLLEELVVDGLTATLHLLRDLFNQMFVKILVYIDLSRKLGW